MRSIRLLVVLAASSILAFAAVAAPAGANAPAHASVAGTISVVDNTVLTSHTFGSVNLVTAVANVTFAGDLVGPAVERYAALTLPDGTVLQAGTGAFTGSVDGRSGTLSYVFSGDGAHGGTITITGSTGALRGAHGQIRYSNIATPGVFNYTGDLRFGH